MCVCACVCVRVCVCACVCVRPQTCVLASLLSCYVTSKLCMCFSEHSNHCVHRLDASMFTSTLFVGASLLTITEINVDRLLALMMGPRYRQVVTLRRVQFSIALSWLLSGGLAVKKIIFPFNVLCVTSTAILLCLISQHAVTQKFSTDFVAKKCKSIAIFNKDSRKLGWKPC